MEILDPEKTMTKTAVPSGTVLILQGQECRSFTILHSGMVELLYTDKLEETPDDTVANSLRIGLVKGEAMIGIVALLSEDEFPSLTIRTVSNCIISSQPVKKEEMIARVQRDNTLNFKILRDLCGRVESSIYLYTNYKYLWHKYASIADSLALGYPGKQGSVYDEKGRTSSLEEYSAYLKGLIKEDPAAALPEEWDYNLFLGRIQDGLRLYEDHDRIRAEDLLDYPQCLFLKRLVHKNDKILAAIFNKDEPSNRYIFEFMARSIVTVATANRDIAREIKELMDMIYSDEGWAARIIREGRDPRKNNFLHFLAKFSWRCRKDTMTLLGIDLFKEYKIFGALKRYQEFKSEEEEQTNTDSRVLSEDMKKRLAKYKGLLPRILNFSTLDDEFKKSFAAGMEELLKYKNKHDSDPALQKLRDEISAGYWKLYENCFLKVIDSDLKGFVPGIMLHFGVVDERLLAEEDLADIDRFYSANLFMDEDIPVMTLPYFLEKIYKSEIHPSMTEMGDYFSTILKTQEKMTKKEKAAASHIYTDTAEDKIRFELRNIAGELSKMLFGNKKRALPFLTSDSLSGGTRRFFIDPELFASLIQKYRKRDYSLFYREVLFKHKLGSDFIQKEVIPNFVFYPAFGNRSIMWQEMDGTNKNSPGRIFYPLFFMEKLEESILTQLASFRWELQKSIAGYNWTDPVEGGLVGVYYDYIQYYKKNPNITPEAKERLTEFIKKTKSDKDRFALDYANWVAFEYEGKMRLNGYARDIFYRYCPFPGEIREAMAQKPDFKVMENRFQSRRLKDSLRLKSKMIKFEKKKVPLPGELVEYSLFLER